MRSRVFVLWILLGLGPMGMAAASTTPEASKIRFISSEFPPFSFTDKDGKAVGFMNEIVSELLLELKSVGKAGIVDPKIEFYPWKRAYKVATEEPNVLMYPLGTVPTEREKFFYWVGPKLTRNVGLYALKKNVNKLKLKNKEELKGKVVGVTRGYSWVDDLVKLGASVDETTDDKILILKLLGDRMPYMAIDQDVLVYLQGEISKENPQYASVRIEKIVSLTDLGQRTFGLSKTTPSSSVEVLKAAFQRLEDKGIIKKILKKYPYLDLAPRALAKAAKNIRQ